MEKTVSSVSGAGKPGQLHLKNEITTLLNTICKLNSIWIKDLSVRQDTIKLSEENIGRTFFDINHRLFF